MSKDLSLLMVVVRKLGPTATVRSIGQLGGSVECLIPFARERGSIGRSPRGSKPDSAETDRRTNASVEGRRAVRSRLRDGPKFSTITSARPKQLTSMEKDSGVGSRRRLRRAAASAVSLVARAVVGGGPDSVAMETAALNSNRKARTKGGVSYAAPGSKARSVCL